MSKIYAATAAEITKIAGKGTFVFDNDGVLYPIGSDFEAQLRKDFNLRNAFQTIANIGNDDVKSYINALKTYFFKKRGKVLKKSKDPFMVFVEAANHARKDFASIFNIGIIRQCVELAYGGNKKYKLIKQDSDIVNSLLVFEKVGKKVAFYTNGLFEHMWKILERHGIPKDRKEQYKQATYDAVDSIYAGAGKPSPQAMDMFLNSKNIDAKESVMFDNILIPL